MTTPVRTLAGTALLVATVVTLAVQTPFVLAEARLAADVAGAVLPGGTASIGALVFVGLGTPDTFAMRITPLCSTVILTAPVLLLGAALFFWLRQARLHRIALGTLAGLGLVIVANQGRYLLLAWLFMAFGRDGFLLGHHWIGAIGVLVAFAAALVLTVTIAAGGTVRPSRRRVAPAAAAPEGVHR